MMRKLTTPLIAALLLGLFSLPAGAQEKLQQITIGYQKANIFALLKYRGTLEKTWSRRVSRFAG